MAAISKKIEALQRLHEAKPDDIIIELKLLLARELERSSLTIPGLAEAIGADRKLVHNMVASSYRPKVCTLQRAFSALGLQVIVDVAPVDVTSKMRNENENENEDER